MCTSWGTRREDSWSLLGQYRGPLGLFGKLQGPSGTLGGVFGWLGAVLGHRGDCLIAPWSDLRLPNSGPGPDPIEKGPPAPGTKNGTQGRGGEF